MRKYVKRLFPLLVVLFAMVGCQKHAIIGGGTSGITMKPVELSDYEKSLLNATSIDDIHFYKIIENNNTKKLWD